MAPRTAYNDIFVRGEYDEPVTRMFGARDGGEFENLYAHVFLTDGERIRRIEYFDSADVDRALARFAERCGERPPDE